jgi:hypothetical protein
MKEVGKEEEKQKTESEDDFDGLHSFWPEQLPEHVSQGPFNAEEVKKGANNDDLFSRYSAMKPSRRYLPCHYFDYIFGSSTGA